MNAAILKPLPIRAGLDQFQDQARNLVKAFQAQDPSVMRSIRQYHPRLPGRANTNDRNPVTDAEIRKTGLTVADAQCIVARWHAFENWPALVNHSAALAGKDSCILQFELAAEAIINGKTKALKLLLRANPDLVRARSTREHQATLLHYAAANAVESYRQKTPRNAVVIAEILLKAGAVVDADLDYGPKGRGIYPERKGSTTLAMAATSCWPAIMGVQIALLKTLLKHGASVDGIPGAMSIVIAALHNGRGDAARFLASCGARLDLEGAAGTGRLDAVKTFFKKDGGLKSNATRAQMAAGFGWACEYGRTRVVSFLLGKGIDVAAMPHGETGLHWAAYGGHAGIVKLLLKRKPPLEIRDQRFQGTPLDWALQGWCHPPPEAGRARYHEVVRLLIAAGAKGGSIQKMARDKIAKLRGDPRMRATLAGKRFRGKS
jgi:hypothetical protein